MDTEACPSHRLSSIFRGPQHGDGVLAAFGNREQQNSSARGTDLLSRGSLPPLLHDRSSLREAIKRTEVHPQRGNAVGIPDDADQSREVPIGSLPWMTFPLCGVTPDCGTAVLVLPGIGHAAPVVLTAGLPKVEVRPVTTGPPSSSPLARNRNGIGETAGIKKNARGSGASARMR